MQYSFRPGFCWGCAGKIIHMILDNYARTSTPRRGPGLVGIRVSCSISCLTSASWLNAVEGFVAKLTKRRLRRGAFC